MIALNKYRKATWLLVAICAAVATVLLALSTMGAPVSSAGHHQGSGTGKLDPAAQESLNELAPGSLVEYVVYLGQPPDPAIGTLPPRGPEGATKIVSGLQESAAEAQAPLLAMLETMKKAGDVADYQPLWIVNAVLVTGSVRSIHDIARLPEVVRVALNAKIQLLEPVTSAQLPSSPEGLTWGIERVRAAHAWHGLGIDGDGVTIAIMDTGVEWLHPALTSNYRGRPGGANPGHSGNWFDAVEGGLEPADKNGHGTHVAGTAVGAGGIGMAPGADWIAARVLDENGAGTIGDIHLAFQWLLAPGGDPTLSPDIVTASWGGSENLLDFIPDIAALKAAGIIPIFSAGNSGPFPASLTAPAAYPGALAIGATTYGDTVAWFSSRGPSGLTDETKPVFVAPGASILSSLPGDTYGHYNGTSMAVPHAAGAYALLLAQSPGLSEADLTGIITTTAVTLPGATPDEAGWGRLDAYAALASVAEAGTLRGRVMDGERPIVGAFLTITTPSGDELVFQSDTGGAFEAALLAGEYDLVADHFGFEAYAVRAVSVNAGSATNLRVDLVPLPQGDVSGRLYDLDSGLPISGVVQASHTPVEGMADELGRFSLQLPVGDYEIIATSRAHRLGRTTVQVSSGAEIIQDFALARGPHILLVDSGGWYFSSQIGYFASALADAGYVFDLWEIGNPFSDVPAAEDLDQYDAVVWSSPFDSPGEIGAGDALYTYLENGGNLLISGQDVGEIDDRLLNLQHWWHSQLRGEYLSPQEEPFTFKGEAGSVFEGIELSLNGPESAANQDSPDRVRPSPNSQAKVAFRHPDGSAAALLAGQCAAFRIAYFGFGIEGVDDPLNRSSLIEGSFAHFAEPETEAGVRIMSDPVQDFAPPGETLTYTVDIFNLSESLTDTLSLTLANADWPAELDVSSLTVGPCQEGSVTLSVAVPVAAGRNITQTVTLTAVSTNAPEISAEQAFHFKTPDRLLLVDDARWRDPGTIYTDALAGAGYSFDYWEVGHNAAGRGSPPGTLLNAYEMVVWFTAFDWFRPVTPAESHSLHEYLAQGGRLFLTSQDYLYYHLHDPLTRDFLGVSSYGESIAPMRIYDSEELKLLGAPVEPLNLDFGPNNNYGDGLVPADGALVAMWHDQGMAAGVANSGAIPGDTNREWRTVFLAFPFEALPTGAQTAAMSGILGWLGDLGDSAFEVNERVTQLHPKQEARRSYTMTLRYADGGQPRPIAITNTIPAGFTVERDSIGGGATFDRDTGQLTWQGVMEPGTDRSIHYRATPRPNLKDGTRLDNVVAIHDLDYDLRFEKRTSIWVDAPDMGDSILTLSPASVRPGRSVTLTLQLRNSSPVATPISATVWLPAGLEPITATLDVNSGSASLQDHRLGWQSSIPAGGETSLSLLLKTPRLADARRFQAMALIDDGITSPLIRAGQFSLAPLSTNLPYFRLDAAQPAADR